MNEWVIAAAVLDRICFIICLNFILFFILLAKSAVIAILFLVYALLRTMTAIMIRIGLHLFVVVYTV